MQAVIGQCDAGGDDLKAEITNEGLTDDFNDATALIAIGVFDGIVLNFDQRDLNLSLASAKITTRIPQQKFTFAGHTNASGITSQAGLL